MTSQIQGEILYAGVSTDPVYTPWMPVQGDFATFAVEVLQNNGTVVQWDVETRTKESITASSILQAKGGFTSGATGVEAKINDSTTNDMQELVRYKFTTGSTASTTNFVVLRALQPSWQRDR